MMKTTAVVLAAGQGTRMKSTLPKVLHPVAGKPMIWHVLQAVRAATTELPVVIVGHGGAEVSEVVGDQGRCVAQQPQLGTAHAVSQARPMLENQTDTVLVSYADMPLLRAETLRGLVEAQTADGGSLALLTTTSSDSRGFGRIVRGPDGTVAAIVEEQAATPAQREITELNVGAYAFPAAWLWFALERISQNRAKREFFLTDVVALAVAEGQRVHSIALPRAEEAIGVNTRAHLAEVEHEMRRRINESHMLEGVTMIDPASTYVDAGVLIGRDTTIQPNTHLLGGTRVGEGCQIGPSSIIKDSQVGDRCSVVASFVEGARLDDEVHVGPFARLRRGAHLMHGVHMGNFGEVKDSIVGPGVKIGHFSYIGDATIGADTNIGAGTITCNFDGEHKNPTEIGEGAFIGSDTMLVAPVKIGDRARTGAGSVVTRDVPADSLAVGMPARVIKKLAGKKSKG